MGLNSWDKGICRIDWRQKIQDKTNGSFELIEKRSKVAHRIVPLGVSDFQK